jgi:hypothetical protein
MASPVHSEYMGSLVKEKMYLAIIYIFTHQLSSPFYFMFPLHARF